MIFLSYVFLLYLVVTGTLSFFRFVLFAFLLLSGNGNDNGDSAINAMQSIWCNLSMCEM